MEITQQTLLKQNRQNILIIRHNFRKEDYSKRGTLLLVRKKNLNYKIIKIYGHNLE